MKKVLILTLLAAFLAFSCKSVHMNANKDVPPGQMKKVTGSQSAKKYAPGQQKKKDHR